MGQNRERVLVRWEQEKQRTVTRKGLGKCSLGYAEKAVQVARRTA